MVGLNLRAVLRSLLRHPLTTAIHLLSLSLGVAFCLLIGKYLQHEWTYNRHYPNYRQLYRVLDETVREGSAPDYSAQCSALFSPTVEGVVPGIEAITRADSDNRKVRIGENLYEQRVLGLDPGAEKVFGLETVQGTIESLKDHHSTFLTPELAERFFGKTDPIGQTLEISLGGEYRLFQVAGILSPFPSNSAEQFDLVINYENLREIVIKTYSEGWGSLWSKTYLHLQPGASPEDTEQAINDLMLKIGTQEQREGLHRYYRLQPIKDVYVSFHNPKGYPTNVEPVASLVLLAIGLGLLTVAGVNYTVLSLGRSLERTREIGVRKVLGAKRGQVSRQFLTETAILTLLSLLIGYLLALLFKPLFIELSKVNVHLVPDGGTLLLLFGLGVLITVIGGSYPAFVASRFMPAAAFRGSVRVGGKGHVRRMLLVVQFTLALCLLTATLLMTIQLRHILTRDLGFDSEQIVELPFRNNEKGAEQLVERFRQEVIGNRNVLAVSGSTCKLGGYWLSARFEEEEKPSDRIYANIIDPSYLEMLDVPLVEGRNFDPQRPDDLTHSIIVNQTFMDTYANSPYGNLVPTLYPNVEIIGVAKDFHFTNLHNAIKPMILTMNTANWVPEDCRSVNFSVQPYVQRIQVRIAPEQVAETIASLRTTWQDMFPERVFEYSFLDESFERWYLEDQRWLKIVTVAASMTLLVTLLGLVGLTVMEMTRRTREIGIRKVLGARERQIVALFSFDLLRLIVVGGMIGVPVAYILVKRWGENFAEVAPFGPFHLLLPLLVVLLIAQTAVYLLARHAVQMNPALTIRQE